MTMKKPTWIVFDVGGVLLDWDKSSTALAEFLGVSHELLLNTMFSYAPKMNIGVISPQEGWKLILDELGKDYGPDEMIRRWRSREFWIQETLDTARQLHAAGYTLAILSNSWLGLAGETDKSLLPEELELFDLILDSSVEGMCKPDEPFYDLLEERINGKGDDVFFIDDAPKNLSLPESKGWQTFLFITAGGGKDSNDQLRTQLLG